MSRKFIISLLKREGSVTKASRPDTSLPSPIPPAGCWSSALAWLQLSWLTELFLGQEWEESARFGRWLGLLCWLPTWNLPAELRAALPSIRSAALNLACRSLTVRHGFPVSSLISGAPFWFFSLYFVTWKNWVTFKQSPILYKLIRFPTVSHPELLPASETSLIVLWGGKV